MISKIEIVPKTRESKILLCDHLDLDSLPNKQIIPLFGPNGVGKSTLLDGLLAFHERKQNAGVKAEVDKASILFSYKNSQDNLRVRKPKTYMESFDPFLLKAKFDAGSVSEGQSILYSIYDLIDGIGTSKNAMKYEGKDIVLLIDELDSGLSIDNLDRILKKLKYYVGRRKDVQIVFSFNNPYVLRYFPDTISLFTGEVIHLETTEDMLSEIEKHKDFRKIRYYKNGKPKVFD